MVWTLCIANWDFIMGREVNLFCIYGRHSVDLKVEIFGCSSHQITFSFLSNVLDTPLTIPPLLPNYYSMACQDMVFS